MAPTVGDPAPEFEAPLCTGETFRATSLARLLDGEEGCVLVFFGFTGSAIAENWWKRYDRAGWDDFDVPVVGISRDGPYSQNAFLRRISSPFRLLSDVNGAVARRYDLLTERRGMAGVETARRATFVLDGEGTITYAWIAEDWISPAPRSEVDAAVEVLVD
ncbi:peroxiredoxin [Halobacteriales archaeon QS_8_65_32]|jgi:peroxiredoxin|nr:MAG: peroxiredoxin [Halobacteriales archaeon QS_8_65_32]